MIYYKCDGCDFTKEIDYLPRAYVLSDGRQVKMEQRHIWCKHCNGISVAESLEDSRANARFQSLAELRALRDNPSIDIDTLSRYERSSLKNAAQRITELEEYDLAWLEWRRLRINPPRCLKCGSYEIQIPGATHENLIHFGCGNLIQCTFDVGSFCGPEAVPHLYDVEGSLQQRGESPRLSTGDSNPIHVPMKLFFDDPEDLPHHE